jgi:two-component system phosphate regulon sensor histidine kinase PhoR
VTLWWIILWWIVTLPLGFLAWFAWRQLNRLRHAVHGLAARGELSSVLRGPSVVQDIHRDLQRIKAHQQEIARQIADEDFSLRAILSSMLEGVLIADTDHRIRLTNERLAKMFSLPAPPIGRTVMEAFRNHLLHQVVSRTLFSDEPQFEELQIEVQESGHFRQRHFQITSVRLRPRENEPLAGVLLVVHDVSQIRSLELVRKEFVANVSHELRTPLSIITGYLETLLDGEAEPEIARRFLQVMHKHAQRLNLLVEDLLALAQLESGKLSLHFQPINPAECVQRVLERMETLITAMGAEVSTELPESLPLVEADPLRLEQVLSNLVDNALKYGSGPGTKVVISARRENYELVIQVRDNGPGIPLTDQPHIFERFYRVHKDRSRDAGGTGIGLSIVKHTIQAHGGRVEVESLPGAGATFTVSLPLQHEMLT